MQGLQIGGLEAHVHEAEGLRRVRLRVELDKLAVVYLEERFGDLPIFAQGEGLLKPQLVIEVAGAGKVRDADGDMCDSGQRGCRRCLRQRQRGKEEQGEQPGAEEPHFAAS